MNKIDEKIIEEELPDSFYAGLKPRKRLKMMVKNWKEAVEVINKYEEDILYGRI